MANVLTIVNSMKMNELHRAVQENRLEGVQFLIANGAEIRNTINDGQTPLHLSCSLNCPHITKELLKNKSREELRIAVNARTVNTGDTALHLAATNNSLENARLLLAHGAHCNEPNKKRQPPRFSEKSIVDLIACVDGLFNYSTVNSQSVLDTLNSCARENLSAIAYARNFKDQTSLQVAMGKFDLPVIDQIVEFRMNQLMGNPWQTGTTYDRLIKHSKAARLCSSRLDDHCYQTAYLTLQDLLREVSDFLEAYKEIGDISLCDQPLLIIIEESLEFFGTSDTSAFITNENFSRMLNYKGVKISASALKICLIALMQLFMRNIFTSELLEAAKNNDSTLIEKCLTGNPDLNETDADGYTALRYAFERENFEIAKMLLSLGADASSEKCRRNEPILRFSLRSMMYSKSYIDLKIVELMFNSVSDEKLFDFVNSRVANDDTTALHWAAAESSIRLVQMLMSTGAIYCAKSARQQEPKSQTDNPDIERLFEFADRSFEQARNGHTKELIHALKKLGPVELSAVVGTRDEEGKTLDKVAESAGHVETAEEIRQLMQASEDYWRRHAGEFFRY